MNYYVKTEERLAPEFLLALVLILALMYLNFRSLGDVAISLITLFLAVVWTFGLAGALGWKLNLMAGMVPILVLGWLFATMTAMVGAIIVRIGIDYPIHVANRWVIERRAGKGFWKACSTAVSTAAGRCSTRR